MKQDRRHWGWTDPAVLRGLPPFVGMVLFLVFGFFVCLLCLFVVWFVLFFSDRVSFSV